MKFLFICSLTLACLIVGTASEHLRRTSHLRAAANIGRINIDVNSHGTSGKGKHIAIVLPGTSDHDVGWLRPLLIALLVVTCFIPCCVPCCCLFVKTEGLIPATILAFFITLAQLIVAFTVLWRVHGWEIGGFKVVVYIVAIVELTCGVGIGLFGVAMALTCLGVDNAWTCRVRAMVDPEDVASIVRQRKAQRACINMYNELLEEIERGLVSKRDVASYMDDLLRYDNEVQQKNNGEFVTEMHKHMDWPGIEAKRRRIEEMLATIPLCLSARLQGPNEVIITCQNLAGNTLGELSMQAKEDRLLELRAAVQQRIPLPEAATKFASWKLVTHEGNIFEQTQNNVAIAELFGL